MDSPTYSSNETTHMVDQLPSELWTTIFFFTYDQHLDFYDMRQCPWLVSHVCHRWREIVKSSPILWSRLLFSPEQREQLKILKHLPSFQYRLFIYLEMSSNISLQVVCRPELGFEPKVEEIVMDTLWQHRARWEDVEIELGWRHAAPHAWARRAHEAGDDLCMPTLRSLHFGAVFFSAGPMVISLLRHAPMLSNLKITHFPIGHVVSAVYYMQDIQWAGVHTLSLDHCDLGSPTLPPLLASLQHVTLFRFDTVNFRQERTLAIPQNSPNGYVYPNLRGLYLCDGRPDRIISKFTAPRVEAFWLEGVFSANVMGEFFSRSLGQVQYLFLPHLTSSDASEFTDQVLSQLPLLRVFSAEDLHLDMLVGIIKYLTGNQRLPNDNTISTRAPTYTPPCPDLYALGLMQTPETPDPGLAPSDTELHDFYDTIADFLEARWPESHHPEPEASDAQVHRHTTDHHHPQIIPASQRPPAVRPLQVRFGLQRRLTPSIEEAGTHAIRRMREVMNRTGLDADIGFGIGLKEERSILQESWTYFEPWLPKGSPGEVVFGWGRE